MSEEKVELERLEATYTQDPDGMQDGNLKQQIKISTEDCGGGIYYVISTERWAFDSVEDLVELINEFKEKTKP